MRHYGYELKNDEPIEIEYVEDEHNEDDDYEPSFWYDNRRYFLKDFIRVHNNPWWSCSHELPEYIHGVLSDGSARSYERPFFIEVLESGDYVNIYEELDLGEEE